MRLTIMNNERIDALPRQESLKWIQRIKKELRNGKIS